MRPFLALAIVALLLAGCSDPAPGGDDGVADGGDADGNVAATQATDVPLGFAGGDFAGNLTGTSTFAITSQCAFDCPNDAQDIIDLTPIIPANAPVELIVTVFGANCAITYEDTYAIGVEDGQRGEFDGQVATFAGVFIRAETGKVELHVYNPGGFGVPPEPAPTADWTAASLVRADRLVPGVPAAVTLQPGQSLNVTGSSIDEAILFAPDGLVTRDAVAPFQVNATAAGEHTLLMLGGEASPVRGPAGATLSARRLALLEGPPQDVQSGAPTTWAFDAPSRPLLAGLGLRYKETAGGFAAAPTTTQYDLSLSTPGGVEVARDGQTCAPVCQFFLLSSNGDDFFDILAFSDFLDERLTAGAYQATAQATGTPMQGVAFALVIL